jgi:UDP-N-acetylmuramoyl-tripeptide--D-alanyl-D-alanine ligase
MAVGGGRTLFTAAEAAAAAGGTVALGPAGTPIAAVAVDSRAVVPGGMFVALPGERVDGHEFIIQALSRGARAAMVRADRLGPVRAALAGAPGGPTPALIVVPDTGRALGELAAWHRRRFDPDVVAVTGSAGKTTTKDMLAAIAARRFVVLKTRGNYNTDIGLPLTLLDLDQRHQVAVIEMGMRGRGEIARLAEIARPRAAVITNIGLAHVERLGSLEGIARAKGEVLDALPSDGFAVLNGDDEWCRRLGAGWGGRAAYFGFGPGCAVTGRDLTVAGTGQRFTLAAAGGEVRVELPLPGRHNVANALAAAAAALELGVSLADVAGGLAEFAPAGMRMAVRRAGGVTIIDDTYNANPASVVAAVATLRELAGGGRAVAVLGEMRELGDFTAAAYREAAEAARGCGVALLVAVGGAAAEIAAAAREAGMPPAAVRECGDHAGAAALLAREVRAGDTVLVKGSRLARMEDVVADLVRRLGGAG